MIFLWRAYKGQIIHDTFIDKKSYQISNKYIIKE